MADTNNPAANPQPSGHSYPPLSDTALMVLEKRYLRRNEDGEIIETPDEMFWRVARHVAGAERPDEQDEWAHRFYDLMRSLRFMPNSPTLMNAGTGQGTLSACFVLPINDSLEAILDGAKAAGMVQKYGGGTGYSLSRLRRKGDYLRSTQGSACGPLSVLEHLDDLSRLITQGGKREGANMGVLRYNHPDIEEFVNYKWNISRCVACQSRGDEHFDRDHEFIEDRHLVNFNISVAVDEEFFRLVDEDGEIPLVNYRRLNHPITKADEGTVVGHINARYLFDQITTAAHRQGDPGLLFMERINDWRANPIAYIHRGLKYVIDATNPCGEKPLFDWDSCNLGHLNLAAYVIQEPGTEPEFDFEQFERDVYTQTRFLDNVITVNYWPLPEIKQMAEDIRRIGNGVMGQADLFFRLRIPYDSPEAEALAEAIAARFERASFEASAQLAVDRGAFPLWEKSIYHSPPQYADRHIKNQPVLDNWVGRKVRNAIRTTIAPTGTTSLIAGCSSSIEPAPGLAYMHQRKIGKDPITGQNVWVQMKELNPWFEEALRLWVMSSDERAEVAKRLIDQESLRDINESMKLGLPEEFLRVFVTAKDISPTNHINMQAVWQWHIDDGVSKTINLPEDATVQDFATAYRLAFRTGCLGITCYRDNSRSYQVLNVRPTDQQVQSAAQSSLVTVAAPDSNNGVPTGDHWGHHPEGVPTNVRIDIAPRRTPVEATNIEMTLPTITTTPTPVIHEPENVLPTAQRRKLGDERPALTHKFRVGDQDGYLTVGFQPDGSLGEVFIKVAKQGSTVHGFADAFAIVTSVALQYGVPPEEIWDKLRNSQFEPFGLTSNPNIPTATSIVDYLARYLPRAQSPALNTVHMPPFNVHPVVEVSYGTATVVEAGDNGNAKHEPTGQVCPDCGSRLYHASGCIECPSCGWSTCG